MKSPSPVAYKTIFRADFKPFLGFFGIFADAAQALEGYPDWMMDGPKVTVYDWAKRRSVIVEHTSFGFEQDSGDQNLETESIDQVLTILPKRFGIREFTRLGYRRKYLVPLEMSFESALAILNTKMLRQEELGSILPAPTDCLYRFDCVGKEQKFFITIAPARKREFLRVLEFNQQFHLNPRGRAKDFEKIQETYPETALMLDIDCFQMGDAIKQEALVNFVLNARKQLEKIATDFNGYCFKAELE